ncbi:MAG: universal stress protein [Fibrobacteria bacterium]
MKITIGYDGSKAANRALKDLANAGLPQAAQAKLIVAVPPLLPLESLAPTGDGIAWYADAYKQAVANQKAVVDKAAVQAKEAVKMLKGMFPAWKLEVETSVDVPSHAILAAAEKWKADLIVVGSKGWNALSKMVIGSVAEKVLHHAHCTVRLGKGASSDSLKPRPPMLLIAFDGSPHAEEAVRQVAARTWPKGTRARIIAVSEFQLVMGDITVALNRSLGWDTGKGSAWPWINKKLDKAVAALVKAGIAAESTILIDDPKRAILSQAKKLKADAIIMGTHGLTGMKRFLLGSVSTSVAAHAPCSVEIIRAKMARNAKIGKARP